jgi:hypothetical protein
MFVIDSVGKYSVQNWIFIDWKVAYNPRRGGPPAGPVALDMCIV